MMSFTNKVLGIVAVVALTVTWIAAAQRAGQTEPPAFGIYKTTGVATRVSPDGIPEGVIDSFKRDLLFLMHPENPGKVVFFEGRTGGALTFDYTVTETDVRWTDDDAQWWMWYNKPTQEYWVRVKTPDGSQVMMQVQGMAW
jgi:hypothetical protein